MMAATLRRELDTVKLQLKAAAEGDRLDTAFDPVIRRSTMPRSPSASPSPAPATRPRVARKRAGAYHHGDLRTAILGAAVRVIEDHGIDRLTLRECARRAGVSHGAPAHHFGDVRGLLTELAADGFEGLLAEMDRREAAAPKDDYAQLVANGQAYVAYALAHRGHFQLMFRSDWIDAASHRLRTTARASYRRLEDHIEAVLRAANAVDANRAERAALAWSIVHGLSTLALEGQLFDCNDPKASPRAIDLVARFMQLARPGIEASGGLGADPARRTKTRAG